MILIDVEGCLMISSDNPLDFFVLFKIVNNFEYSHLQNDFYHENRSKQMFSAVSLLNSGEVMYLSWLWSVIFSFFD